MYTVPIGMKKCRPGILLCVICKEEDKDEMVRLIFRHTSTIGIRENISYRYVLNRTTVEADTPFGTVRKKISEGYGVKKAKYEYEDLASIAREKGLSLLDVIDSIEK